MWRWFKSSGRPYLALGLIAAMAAATATPSLAQGGYTLKDQASGLVSVAQLTVTATTATASTIMSLGTVTDTAAEPSLLSAMTGVFALRLSFPQRGSFFQGRSARHRAAFSPSGSCSAWHGITSSTDW